MEGQAEALVMKGVEKVASLNSRYSVDKSVAITTWQISRVFRRDFNLMSFKIFKALAARRMPGRIEHCISELETELTLLEERVANYPSPPVAPTQSISVRLVCPETSQLFDILSAMDRIMVKLLAAHDQEVVDDVCADFFAAYGRLKNALFRAKKAPANTDGQQAANNAALSADLEADPSEANSNSGSDGISSKVLNLLGSIFNRR